MERITETAARTLNAIAAIWAFGLAFVIVGDVVGRMFGYPLQGTAEIVANSIVAIVFLQFPLAVKSGALLRATVLYNAMPARIRALLDIAAYALGLVLFLAIAKGSWQDMLTGFRIGEFEGEGALRVPVYPVRAIIVGLSLLVASVYTLLIVQAVMRIIDPTRSKASADTLPADKEA